MYLKICKVRDVKSPVRANVGIDAGLDMFIPEDWDSTVVNPHESVLIPSGIKMEVPAGYMIKLFNKSGVASKKCLLVRSWGNWCTDTQVKCI